MRRSLLGLVIIAALAQPAAAQNVADNAGRWWNQPQSGDAFRFYNPLTTVYGRIGFLFSFNPSLTGSQTGVLPFSIDVADQWGGVLGMGARLMPVLRAELQASGLFTTETTAFGTTGGRMRSAQILANLYFDGAPLLGTAAWGLNPYVFAGLGISFNTWTFAAVPLGIDGDHSRAAFAWNAGAGLQYQPLNNLIFDLSYRYLDIGRFASNPLAVVATPPVTTSNFTAHQIMLSVVIPIDGLLR